MYHVIVNVTKYSHFNYVNSTGTFPVLTDHEWIPNLGSWLYASLYTLTVYSVCYISLSVCEYDSNHKWRCLIEITNEVIYRIKHKQGITPLFKPPYITVKVRKRLRLFPHTDLLLYYSLLHLFFCTIHTTLLYSNKKKWKKIISHTLLDR